MDDFISSFEKSRLLSISRFETELREQGFVSIAGIDEAGRGPLAGPVFAAACILPCDFSLAGLNDSKQLTASQRDFLFEQIILNPRISFAIAQASVEEIDQYNILQATFLSMKRAVKALPTLPDYLLVDGNRAPQFEIRTKTIVKGDALSISIAAASILAKVSRDRLMIQLDAEWPEYGFKKHKGYGTQQHLKAIAKYGLCPIHRKSFEPIRLKKESQPSLF